MSGSFLDNPDFAEKAMEIQKGVLCSDAFLIHKRPEIAGYFAMETDIWLQTEYLKNSFRMEEFTELDIGGIRAGYRADEDGLTMWRGHYLTREAEARISWEDARYWVNSYIEDGVYLLPGEKAEQIDTNGMYQQLDLFTMFSEQIGGIAMKEAEQGIIPAEKKNPEPSKNVLPKEQLDTILRSGGGRDNSRKRKLIEEDKYLSPAAKEAYAEYKEEQAQKKFAAQPEIDKSGAVNFRITDDVPGNDGAKEGRGFAPKEKFRRNIEAIRTLEKIESENRSSTCYLSYSGMWNTA